MGACIKVEGNTAIIDGVEKFTGAEVPHRIFAPEQHLLLQVLQQRVLPWWMILYTFCADTRTSTESSVDSALKLSV